ncbi:uncharacterized protein LOC107477853 [Arachis duranensis]|uniref:Uncharacterized protein LOC107477853 n=1 Tax=Arachis duranensis TaxID=130453 RepID=A0A6P4CL95_ARADU|nr:uncharacterized protein LOC107477853 [Arachis duranensis]
MGVTPFHHFILEVQLPKHFNKPTNMRYDGTQDPQEHLTAFEARKNLEGVGDEVRCHAIPITLAGPAIRWFNTLPQGSVTTFADITRTFLAQFTTRIAKAKHPINLLGVTQRSREPTRKYLDRFNDECLEIDGLTASVTSLCLTNGFLNKDFRKYLTTKPVWTMQEIQNVARKYINDEEVSQVVAANKRQPTYNHARQPSNREKPKEHSKNGAPAKTYKPFSWVRKFTNYTPLTAPIVDVYQQIADKGILSKPQPLKDRTGGNKNLYCDYHKGFGHKTQDCFDLKDALEQAIREVRRDIAPRSKSVCKKDGKVLAISSSSSVPPSRKVPSILFGPEDQWIDGLLENPPMVITTRVGTSLVKRILVDTCADSNIKFRNVFDPLGLRDNDLNTHQHGVVGLGDHFIKPDGRVSLPVFIRGGQGKRSVMVDFVGLRDSMAYNLILGRDTINEFGAVICTKLLMMKFLADDGSVGSIRGDLEMAVTCDNASLSLRKKSKEASRAFLADLDARVDDKPRSEPEGDLEKFRVGYSEKKFTFVNRNLPHNLKEPLEEMIRANGNLFVWTPADMPGIDLQFMSHHLAVKAEAKPVAQRRRKMSEERVDEVARGYVLLQGDAVWDEKRGNNLSEDGE